MHSLKTSRCRTRKNSSSEFCVPNFFSALQPLALLSLPSPQLLHCVNPSSLMLPLPTPLHSTPVSPVWSGLHIAGAGCVSSISRVLHSVDFSHYIARRVTARACARLSARSLFLASTDRQTDRQMTCH